MSDPGASTVALNEIRADRRLVEELFASGAIGRSARDHALAFLYPQRNWGLWVSRLLLLTGAGLILAGIIYFFAFNWAELQWTVKFGSIELAILACIAAAWWYGTERLAGKVLLLSASTLVGVFLAVFGQVYQTGADSYTLFMMWSLLTAGWAILANFAVLWAGWLLVTNLFLYMWWDQSVLADPDAEMFIFSILGGLNLLFLLMREVLVREGAEWPAERWTRMILIVATLAWLLPPILALIEQPSRATSAILVGGFFALAAHVGLLALYRYKLPDLPALSIVVLSSCLVIVAAGFSLFQEMLGDARGVLSPTRGNPLIFLMTGALTIAVFAFAIATLRSIASSMESHNVR